MKVENVLCLSALLVVFLQACAPSGPTPDYADTVYSSGRIYTVDPDRPWAEAVAIKDGRFMAVGSDSEIESLKGPETVSVDLQSRLVIPGIHDAHTHYLVAGYTEVFECVLETADGLNDLVAKLDDCRSTIRDSSPWLVVQTRFDVSEIEGFDKGILDGLYPDNPVFIRDPSFHNAFINSVAIEICGVDENTPDPRGGKIVRDPETGEPTGLFIDVASNLPRSKIPYTQEERDAATQAVVDLSSRFGITSAQEASATTLELDSLNRLDRAGTLNQHVFAHIAWGRTNLGSDGDALIDRREEFVSELVRPDGVKVFIDGVPVPPYFTHSIILPDGSIDPTNLIVDAETLNPKVVEWDKAGLRIKMHVSGDGAARFAINAFEHARQINGDSGVAHELAHLALISDDDLPRLSVLGIVGEMSPSYGGFPTADEPWMDAFWRYRSLLDNDAWLTAGSDFLITGSPNPFPWIQSIITRPGQGIGLEALLEIMTINGARAVAMEDELGSIEAGKIANMAVLSQNLFEIAPETIAATRVLRTVFRGSTVYEERPE